AGRYGGRDRLGCGVCGVCRGRRAHGVCRVCRVRLAHRVGRERRVRRVRWMPATRASFLPTWVRHGCSAWSEPLARSPTLVPMCGIVGYVGRASDGTALDVVM